MYLVQQVRTASHMRDEFVSHGRGNQFSYRGFDALFEYLEQLAEDLGEPIEFDVVALCCGWTEYADAEEMAEYHGITRDDFGLEPGEDDDEEFEDAVVEEMHNRGMLVEFDGGYLFSEGW